VFQTYICHRFVGSRKDTPGRPDLSVRGCRQNSQVRLHHLDKLEGAWKAVCSSAPSVTQGLGKQEVPAVSPFIRP
jgi:hypothetical protein